MKTNIRHKNMTTARRQTASSHPRESGTTAPQKRKNDKEFMCEMNQFIAKAGLLSDDPFFGGI